MGLKELLKSYIAISGITLTQIQTELNTRNGTSHGVQNLSKKINNETLRYNEIEQIADILGYKIEWIKKESIVANTIGNKAYQDYMLKLMQNIHFLFNAMQNIPPALIEQSLENGNLNPEKFQELVNSLEKSLNK
ncbi:hypothetical protein [Clostridium paridis]|uniref:Uncharacterized protein n=1 Tax=Clostridium paridis TaxID=2803863 RepID=A0A937K5F3_9CLOT|nr:hypothetical protein [Clostridium paridis]MBL4933642.1 hypothetical protein [Clostridium paridis]